jgi:hypothetical protein
MVKLIIRTVISVLLLISIFLIGWNYLGDIVLTPLFIPLGLLLILILMFFIEKFWLNSETYILFNEYMFVIIVFVALYLTIIIGNILVL